ncbi:MAG: HAMP domain-containing protein [Spirochaetes bacterium]|nr:MAG: HAMP domain-containing protein [Spirochaetota bacterium]
MKLSWKNLSISKKIILLSSLIILSFAVTVFAYLIPLFQDESIRMKKEKVRDIVATALSVIEAIDKEYAAAGKTKEDAQKSAVGQLRGIRYGDEGKDYVWINDFQPVVIMHPFASDLEGKNVGEKTDPTGKKFFKEMVRICQEREAGYVEYMWQYKDQKERVVPKISFVKAYKPWGWIIGTGVYYEDVRESILSTVVRILQIFGGIIGISILLSLFVSRKISKSIRVVVGRLQELASAEGDLTGRLPVESGDEVGELSLVLNRFLDQFEGLVVEIMDSSRALSQAVGEISTGNQDLSDRTSRQASSLEEVASSLEQAVASVRQNAENTMAANGLASETVRIGEEGNRIVLSAVESIRELSHSSEKISEIVEAINGIAFQTNLLALNAAVEAARAGDSGRGFAVVAAEVRNLAQRVQGSAKEIGVLIKEALEKMQETNSRAGKSSEALQNITESIKRVGGLISEISAASEEQRQGMDQINAAVTDMDRIGQQNAALVEQTAAASEEMSRQVEVLLEKVSRFKTSEHSRERSPA